MRVNACVLKGKMFPRFCFRQVPKGELKTVHLNCAKRRLDKFTIVLVLERIDESLAVSFSAVASEMWMTAFKSADRVFACNSRFELLCEPCSGWQMLRDVLDWNKIKLVKKTHALNGRGPSSKPTDAISELDDHPELLQKVLDMHELDRSLYDYANKLLDEFLAT